MIISHLAYDLLQKGSPIVAEDIFFLLSMSAGELLYSLNGSFEMVWMLEQNLVFGQDMFQDEFVERFSFFEVGVEREHLQQLGSELVFDYVAAVLLEQHNLRKS